MPSNRCHRAKNCPAYNEFVRNTLPLLCTPSEQAHNTCEYVVQTMLQHIETFRKGCRCLKKLAEKLIPNVTKAGKRCKGATATTAKDVGKSRNSMLKKFLKRKSRKGVKPQPNKSEDPARMKQPTVQLGGKQDPTAVEPSLPAKVSRKGWSLRRAGQGSSETKKNCKPKSSENVDSSDEEFVTFCRSRRPYVIDSSDSDIDCDTESCLNEPATNQEGENTNEDRNGYSSGIESNENNLFSSENHIETNQDCTAGQESVITSTVFTHDKVSRAHSPIKAKTATVIKQEVADDDYSETMVDASVEVEAQESLALVDCDEGRGPIAVQPEEQNHEKASLSLPLVNSSFVFKTEPVSAAALSPVRQAELIQTEECEDFLELESIDSDEFYFDDKIQNPNSQAEREEIGERLSENANQSGEQDKTLCASRYNQTVTTGSGAANNTPSDCTPVADAQSGIIAVSSRSISKKMPKIPIEAPVPEVSRKCRTEPIENASLQSIIEESRRRKSQCEVSIRKPSSDERTGVEQKLEGTGNPKRSIRDRLGHKEKSSSLTPDDARLRLSRQNKFKKLPSAEKVTPCQLMTTGSSPQEIASASLLSKVISCSLKNATRSETSVRPEFCRLSQPQLGTEQNRGSELSFADLRLEDVKITIATERSKRVRRLTTSKPF